MEGFEQCKKFKTSSFRQNILDQAWNNVNKLLFPKLLTTRFPVALTHYCQLGGALDLEANRFRLSRYFTSWRWICLQFAFNLVLYFSSQSKSQEQQRFFVQRAIECKYVKVLPILNTCLFLAVAIFGWRCTNKPCSQSNFTPRQYGF